MFVKRAFQIKSMPWLQKNVKCLTLIGLSFQGYLFYGLYIGFVQVVDDDYLTRQQRCSSGAQMSIVETKVMLGKQTLRKSWPKVNTT